MLLFPSEFLLLFFSSLLFLLRSVLRCLRFLCFFVVVLFGNCFFLQLYLFSFTPSINVIFILYSSRLSSLSPIINMQNGHNIALAKRIV